MSLAILSRKGQSSGLARSLIKSKSAPPPTYSVMMHAGSVQKPRSATRLGCTSPLRTVHWGKLSTKQVCVCVCVCAS
jgi:hypothetical protein